MENPTKASELLADDIAQKIRTKIQNQQYKAGEKLTVRRLCEEFGTSETPVKQALNQLVTTGLVVSVPKCGMKVRTFNFQDMKNNWEARMMIEQFCALPAVERARHDENFVTEITNLLQLSNREYQTCIDSYNKENFNPLHEHDYLLHTMIVKCNNNEQILSMYHSLNAHAGMFMGYTSHTPNTLKEVQKQHTEMVNQLILCNVEGLKKSIETHIYSTIQIYRTSAK